MRTFYRTERNSKSVDAFMRYADELAALVKTHRWQLERKFNRGYCGFKAGFFNAFGINWWASKTFGVFVKISQAESNRLTPRPSDYSGRWKEAYYPIQIGKTRMKDFVPVFEFAYRKLAGNAEK